MRSRTPTSPASPTSGTTAALVALLVAVVLALVAAAVLDAQATVRFGPGPGAQALGVLVSAVLGATQAWVAHALARRGGVANAYVAPVPLASAAFVASATALLLVRAPSPWLALGPFGAGPAGELPLIVLPLASLVAALASLPSAPDAPRPR